MFASRYLLVHGRIDPKPVVRGTCAPVNRPWDVGPGSLLTPDRGSDAQRGWLAGHWSLDPPVTRGARRDADVIIVMGVNLVVGVDFVPGLFNTVGHV